jgi:predicted DCC family thiol-disulfide oxidoreductase YuxK
VNDLNELGGRVLVIFDGHCGLCNRSVRWCLRRDGRDRMRFVASESPKVAELLARLGIGGWDSGSGTNLPSSIVVVRNAGGANEQALVRSEAVLALLGELPRPWPGVAAVARWIPRVVRDVVYRLIARWRFRIWGRLESCPLPTVEERGRFL